MEGPTSRDERCHVALPREPRMDAQSMAPESRSPEVTDV